MATYEVLATNEAPEGSISKRVRFNGSYEKDILVPTDSEETFDQILSALAEDYAARAEFLN